MSNISFCYINLYLKKKKGKEKKKVQTFTNSCILSPAAHDEPSGISSYEQWIHHLTVLNS